MNMAVAENVLPSQERYYHTVARNLFLNQEFCKILDAFSERNIPLLPLKGIALIQKIIPDMGHRYMGDLDLLVKVEDVVSATKLLKEMGYTSPEGCFNSQKPYSYSFNSIPFSKSAKIPYFIHLHWHVMNSSLPLLMFLEKVSMAEIWQSATLEEYGERKILTMAPHHLLVFLCLHAFKHSFDKISLFEDIHRSIQFYEGELKWEEVMGVAQKWKVSVPLYYSLHLTSKMFPENKEVRKALEKMNSVNVSRSGEKILTAITKDRPGTNNLVYPLYLEMNKGLFKKSKFILLSLFPPPKQIRRMYAIESKTSIFSFYLKRFFGGFKQLLNLVLS